MKIYFFNSDNGLYEGETFEEVDRLEPEDCITPIPPPIYEHGQVPVFDPQKNAWTVIPVSIANQLLKVSPSSPKESA